MRSWSSSLLQFFSLLALVLAAGCLSRPAEPTAWQAAPSAGPTALPTTHPAAATQTPPPLPATNTATPTQTSTATPPQPSATSTSELPLFSGDLSNQVARLETNAARAGSQGFLVPDEQALADFASLAEDLLAGRLVQAGELAAQYDYELVRYADRGAQGAVFYVLREQKPFRRAWGLYIFRMDQPADAQNVIIEAPHVLADEGTPAVALLLFRGLEGRALLIAGAHRAANQDGSADVAHNPDTIFQVIHNALAAPNPALAPALVVQVHGFASERHPGYPMVVLGGNPPDHPDLPLWLESLEQALSAQMLTTGICDGSNWEDLCGETNVQAGSLSVGMFVHLELSEAARANPAAILQAFLTIMPPKPD